MRKVVTGLPYLKIDHEGTCKGCARGKNIKNPFPKSETKTKGTLELIFQMYVVQFPPYPWVVMNIMLHLLMTIQKILGYISWKQKDEVFGKFKEFKALIEN